MKPRPIPAVGLSSALVQTIDFGINTLRKDHVIYQSNEPCDAQAHNAAVLQDAIYNLYRLIDVIDASELKRLQAEKSEQKKGTKLSDAAQQLLKHSEGVKELVEGLRDALIAAQARGTSEDRSWGTLREALMNGTWKKKDVTGAKKKLRALRREVDASLLLALRQYLDQSAETGLPVFARDEADVPLRHWEKWQNEALDAIHANEWKPGKKKNVEEFGKIVDGLITLENEAHFCEEIFRALHFEEANECLYAVEAPMDGSMKWVFEDERMSDEGGLLEWLGNIRGDNLFWISGKPGCGKTVLTKYLFRNPQIFDYLEAWSGAAPGITAGFFFWNSGTELQNSPTGMLRSILYEALQDMIYGPLEQDQGIIQWLFAERWNQFTSYGGGLHDFAFAELRKSFELMVADVSKKFLFMIDGLDEMDEHPNVLDMLITVAKKDNVKVIVSSTARSELEAAFKDRPNLVLDEWTKKDSAAHIMHEFGELDVLNKLRRRSDNVEEMNAINTLAEKADGNFLWAKLATAYILHGITEDDNFSAMRNRAWDLPHKLHHLIPRIIESMSTEEAEQLWKVVSLLENHVNATPGLLPLSIALSADTKTALATDPRPPKTADTTKRVEESRSLLTRTCRSLLIAFDVSNPEEPETRGRPESLKVSYAHRVIRSILIPKSTSDNPFDPTTQWSLSYLLGLKSLRPCTAIWPTLSLALNTALLRFQQTKKLPATYLDATLSVALTHHAKDPTSSDLPGYPTPQASAEIPMSPTTPLDIAVLLNLASYVALKAKTADKKEVRRALEFSRAVRKRMGQGGEQKWLAGKGRDLLRDAWGAERSDVEALLEYYGKSVKFGSAKMWVEVPEYD
ncbi:hypothetical protein DE146DRAFT_448807 [Phaeosphaeria sp. MPI-PUGE-AT-0046c]|nr:hypothetical protein DE146DRAFT_448807 [Phaeosphaeria sp. MPI-PUGE-AT-0046c]